MCVCVGVCAFVCVIQACREGRAAQAGCLGIWLSIVAWQPHTISPVLSPSPPPSPHPFSLCLSHPQLPPRALSLCCTVAPLPPIGSSTLHSHPLHPHQRPITLCTSRVPPLHLSHTHLPQQRKQMQPADGMERSKVNGESRRCCLGWRNIIA